MTAIRRNKKLAARVGSQLKVVFGLVGTQVGGVVSLGGLAELVVVSGQDSVQDDACQSGDGQTGQRDGGVAHREGDAAHRVEAQTADEHHRGDNQVAGLGQVDLVLPRYARPRRRSYRRG